MPAPHGMFWSSFFKLSSARSVLLDTALPGGVCFLEVSIHSFSPPSVPTTCSNTNLFAVPKCQQHVAALYSRGGATHPCSLPIFHSLLNTPSSTFVRSPSVLPQLVVTYRSSSSRFLMSCPGFDPIASHIVLRSSFVSIAAVRCLRNWAHACMHLGVNEITRRSFPSIPPDCLFHNTAPPCDPVSLIFEPCPLPPWVSKTSWTCAPPATVTRRTPIPNSVPPATYPLPSRHSLSSAHSTSVRIGTNTARQQFAMLSSALSHVHHKQPVWDSGFLYCSSVRFGTNTGARQQFAILCSAHLHVHRAQPGWGVGFCAHSPLHTVWCS